MKKEKKIKPTIKGMKEEIKQIISARIKKHGLKMTKQISGGGLFSLSAYDNRTAYSLEEVFRLNREGFSVKEDIGVYLLNSFIAD